MAIETLMADRARVYARDARWITMLVGLDQLDDDELSRLQSEAALPEAESCLLTDSANYDPGSGMWCALAVGVGVPAYSLEQGVVSPTASYGRGLFVDVAQRRHPEFSTNPLSGVRGKIFTNDRLMDLRVAVHGLIEYRRATEAKNPIEWSVADAEAVFVVGARGVGGASHNVRA